MTVKQLFYFCLIFVVSCAQEQQQKLSDQYISDLDTYKEKLSKGRVKYLQLPGLFKLDSIQTFGSSASNDFVLNIPDIPKILGTIRYQDSLLITPETQIAFTTDNDTISESRVLNIDTNGSSKRMYYKHINWQIITRSGSKYLRVWNTKNPAIAAFKGFESFTPNANMIFEGNFTYYKNQKEASVKSQLGVNANTNFIGNVSFIYEGNTHHLEVGADGFTMVGDLTTGDSTYGGGRYIYLDVPQTDGKVQLDFNYLYNPPCAFNSYTTCLYPPRQNHLPFEIAAGETITTQH